jgi:hypothetical protein
MAVVVFLRPKGTKKKQFSQFLTPTITSPTAPYILYLDGLRMQLGKWTTQGGNVNNSNQLFFKFGSVVGFKNTVAADGTVWSAGAVMVSPTGINYTNFADIPRWNGSNTTDGYVSSAAYHTQANVKAGRGDPCKLVGLTVAQIQAGTIDNGKYRLPTNAENAAYSSPTFVAGNGWATGTTPTAGIHSGNIGTSFLPASGRRNIDGSTYGVGYHGYWWSSQANSGTTGKDIYFVSSSVATANNDTSNFGMAVRCVPQ